jgi:hypothetical protein
MDIQSLLFGRDAGWTEGEAKQWAKSHGYKHGKVDITDQYVRIRQFDPSGLKVKRTITLGRGIRAVVAREEEMKTKRRRSTKRSKARATSTGGKPAFGSPAWFKMYPRKSKGGKRKARRAKEATAVAAPRKRRSRRVRTTTKVATPRRVAAPRKRRGRRVRAKVRAATPRTVRTTRKVAAPRKRRARRVRAKVASPRRKRRVARAWHGDTAGHRKAAKKGHKRKRKSSKRRVREVSEVRTVRTSRKRKARRVRTNTKVAAPRKRHHRKAHRKARRVRSTVRSTVRSPVVRSSHRRRSYRARAAGGGTLKKIGSKLGMLAVGIGVAGAGFTVSDAIDRFLATYNPAGDKMPDDKFVSDGTGMLGNSLNIAAPPHLVRIGAIVAQILLPAVAATQVKNKYVRTSMEGYALGAGIKGLSMLWTNVLMPLLAPKDGDAEKLKGSYVARLYPAEVAAKLNLASQTTNGPGVLSDAPNDVGPFALAGSSPYPDAAQALRQEAGISGSLPYPDAEQALRHNAGLGFVPRPAAPYRGSNTMIRQWQGAHPSYRPGGNAQAAALSNRWGNYRAGYAIPNPPGMPVAHQHHHHHCMLRAKTMYPTYTDAQLHAWCLARPHHTHPYLYESPAAPPPVSTVTGPALGDGPNPNDAPAGGSGDAPSPIDYPSAPAATGGPPPAPADPVGPPSYSPGPGSTVGPGPQPLQGGKGGADCGCVGENNSFLGFIGDEEDKESVLSMTMK